MYVHIPMRKQQSKCQPFKLISFLLAGVTNFRNRAVFAAAAAAATATQLT